MNLLEDHLFHSFWSSISLRAVADHSMSGLTLFLSVFGITFVAELPDKTAFAALVMATTNHPGAIFLGAALAFTLHAFLAVALGSVLGLLPEQAVAIGSGMVFVILAVLMWLRREPQEEGDKLEKRQGTFSRTIVFAFVVIFTAEFGDLTQFSTAALAARHHRPLLVFAAATLALWVVSALAIAVGNRAGKLLKPKLLKRGAALIFLVVGLGLMVRAAFVHSAST